MTMKKDVNMSKAVMISISPKWCELIANGKKKVEVRKTKPKLKPPFKCYIYCTKGKNLLKARNRPLLLLDGVETRQVLSEDDYCSWEDVNGKVIGEFVCDYIVRHCEMENADIAEQMSCVKREDILKYSNGKEVFGWHISDLVIYDTPKELSKFETWCKYYEDNSDVMCDGCEWFYYESNESEGYYSKCCCDGLKPLTRPPQSWCYVEERGEM